MQDVFGVHFDNKLKFDTHAHIENIFKKANRKLNTLTKVTPFIDVTKRKIIMNLFFNFQFNYLSCYLDVL